MSLPSDILSPEEQFYIYSNVNIDEILNSGEVLSEQQYVEQDHDTKIDLLPSPVSGLLSKDEYAGHFEFEVNIHPNTGAKNTWVYSSILNKVYMDIKSSFPVDFRAKHPPHCPLYIRATPVFSSPQYALDTVTRCISHSYSDRNDLAHFNHIIRCENPNALYVGECDKKEHLSVIIPFSYSADGSENKREIFMFVCKNSCPLPGINRRDIEVIFSLENASGDVLGRKSFQVKICSCPNRDWGKDEKKYKNKNEPKLGTKKRKLEKTSSTITTADDQQKDTKEYELTLSVIGKHNVHQILKYCHDVHAGDLLNLEDKDEDAAIIKKCINEINIKRKQLKNNDL